MVQVPPAAFVASVKAAFPDTSKPMLVGCKAGGRSGAPHCGGCAGWGALAPGPVQGCIRPFVSSPFLTHSSAHAITLLPEYNDLTNVTGGFGAWVAGGLPTGK